jgi:hypothetical protein
MRRGVPVLGPALTLPFGMATEGLLLGLEALGAGGAGFFSGALAAGFVETFLAGVAGAFLGATFFAGLAGALGVTFFAGAFFKGAAGFLAKATFLVGAAFFAGAAFFWIGLAVGFLLMEGFLGAGFATFLAGDFFTGLGEGFLAGAGLLFGFPAGLEDAFLVGFEADFLAAALDFFAGMIGSGCWVPKSLFEWGPHTRTGKRAADSGSLARKRKRIFQRQKCFVSPYFGLLPRFYHHKDISIGLSYPCDYPVPRGSVELIGVIFRIAENGAAG